MNEEQTRRFNALWAYFSRYDGTGQSWDEWREMLLVGLKDRETFGELVMRTFPPPPTSIPY
jgi:hypothetical protein